MSEQKGEALDQAPALPGSVRLAETIERRQFLRRTATSLFFGFTAVSTGTASLFGFLANPAAAAGPCCPSDCCGPSPCCNTSCCNKPCCSLGSSDCINNGTTCLGKDFREYGSGVGGCWSCTVPPPTCRTTLCCDCKTNNTTGCSNFTNRCICYQTIPGCGPPAVRATLPVTGGNQKSPLWWLRTGG
jgi:hypothetical protein